VFITEMDGVVTGILN